jgi:hypothetical protein
MAVRASSARETSARATASRSRAARTAARASSSACSATPSCSRAASACSRACSASRRATPSRSASAVSSSSSAPRRCATSACSRSAASRSISSRRACSRSSRAERSACSSCWRAAATARRVSSSSAARVRSSSAAAASASSHWARSCAARAALLGHPLAERLALARLLLRLRAPRRRVLLPLLGDRHLALQLQHALAQPRHDARQLAALRLGGAARLLRHVARALRLGLPQLGLRVEQLQLGEPRVERRELVLPPGHLAPGERQLDREAAAGELGVPLGALALAGERPHLAWSPR